MAHRLAYILCATPRSGTTLLCDLLSGTGQAGRPQSFFRSQDIERRATAWGLQPTDFKDQAKFERAYLQAVLQDGAGDSEVFGLRLMWGTLAELLDRLAPLYPGAPKDERLERAFGPLVYIHVSRRDKVAQAISLSKAEQSGLWHVGADGSERQRSAPPAPARYDADRIAELVEELERDDFAWNDHFARRRIAPVRVEYEALAASPRAELGQLLIALDLPPELADGVAVRTSKMGDVESDAWAERYRRQS